MSEAINKLVIKMRETRPLVLNITNDVTMDFVANGLLSLGASPVMSKAEQELEELIKIAGSVVINLGTLDSNFIKLSHNACAHANKFEKPIILDPVGAGASRYRTDTCLQLINDYKISIIRGNASEIMALSKLTFATKGVDSTTASEQAIESAQTLAALHNKVVVVSGETDFVIMDNEIARFNRGSHMMPMVTGTGCLLSAVVGAFHAVESNPFKAATAAIFFYGVCGEIAAANAKGPGSFKSKLVDALHTLPEETYYNEN